MIKMLGQITKLKGALWVNAFLFYLKRLWLVGKLVPDTVFSSYAAKRNLSVAAVVIRQMIDFIGKPLYLLVFAVFPVIMLADGQPFLGGMAAIPMAQILFFLNCVIGSLGDSQIFSVTRDKVTCIKYLHMNAKTCIQSYLIFKYAPFFLYYLIWLPIIMVLLGGSILQGISLWVLLFSFRMMGEAFQLFIFDRTQKVLSRGMIFEWILICIGLTGAYLPVFLGKGFFPGAVLMHPVSVIICAGLGLFCLWYIMTGYPSYETKLHRSLDLNFLLSSLLKASSGSAAAFKEVEIKEKDVELSDENRTRFRNLKGYACLNSLFFARHRRQLVKPIYYRLLAAALLFAASAFLVFTNRETARRIAADMTVLLPFFVYVMYFMTVADKASRAMFYNCDKDMLHYAFYRKPKTILRNFKIRLCWVALYDLVIAGGVCLAAAGFCLLSGIGLLNPEFLLFCAAILLLSILFTAHHLCLYYIFQPYSESLQVKNPFFTVLNIAMYVICFLCLEIKATGLAFTIGVLGFTILYIAAALLFVYRLAPRTFRIK